MKKYKFRDASCDIKPRERLLNYGVNSLSDYELLAIILRTGCNGLNVLDLSKDILTNYYSLSDFQNITYNELIKIKGIGKVKAIEIIASLEFGKRVNNHIKEKTCLKDVNNSYLYLKNMLEHLDEERVIVLYLNVKGELVGEKIISIGSVFESTFDIKKIIKWAFKFSSSHIILAHNHPSGDPTPSKQDIINTKEVQKICSEFDVFLLDHIIIGDNNFFSFLNSSKRKH